MASVLSPKEFLSQLVQKKVISQTEADSYEIGSLQKGTPIDVYLLEETKVGKDSVMETKAGMLQVSYINVDNAALDPQALSLIPEQLARKYIIIPYKYDTQNETLYVATSDPQNYSLEDFLQSKTGKKVIFVLSHQDDINKTINRSYKQSLSPEVKEALQEISPTQTQTQQQKQELTVSAEQDVESNAPIARIVHTILEFAVKSRSSDIHIEPQETKIRVRYRIDGILEEKLALPRGIHEHLISRIKILAQMKIDEKRVPQDGRFEFTYGKEAVDLRVSTLPTVNGEKVVMRILQKSSGIPTFSELGLRGPQLRAVEDAIARPNGIILVTGPTGSGKTTTLYSILNKLNTPNINILTLEDPVEYEIMGINQVQINPLAGLTFATGLRSFLRQDPNIILVGEIRDKETTQLAVQAALTGHLVFSTLHTNDAATSIPRLIDLGAEPFLISSILNISIAQRITRKVCPFCSQLYVPPPEVVENIKQVLGDLLPKEYREGKQIQLKKGNGCDQCNHTGYLGRVAIFETLRNSETINTMILKEASARDIEAQAVKEGLISMKQDGYLKAVDGITTIEEVLRVAET